MRSIRVGMRVHVAYAGARREPTFTSLVRFISDEYVRLDLYSLPSTRLPPQRGEPVVVISQDGDQLRAFDAGVIGVESSPPALVVTPPIEGRRDERRRFPRVTTDIAVTSASWLDAASAARRLDRARVVDLSVGGLRLRAHGDPLAGTELNVHMRLTPSTLAEVTGSVLGVDPAPDSPDFHVRMGFTQVDPQTFASIVAFVTRALEAEARFAA